MFKVITELNGELTLWDNVKDYNKLAKNFPDETKAYLVNDKDFDGVLDYAHYEFANNKLILKHDVEEEYQLEEELKWTAMTADEISSVYTAQEIADIESNLLTWSHQECHRHISIPEEAPAEFKQVQNKLITRTYVRSVPAITKEIRATQIRRNT